MKESLLISARINYNTFKVPTSMVESIKTKRYYTKEQLADLDFKTAKNKLERLLISLKFLIVYFGINYLNLLERER